MKVRLFSAALALLLVAAPSHLRGQPSESAVALDPGAMAALDASRAYLRGLKSFEARVDVTLQHSVEQGVKVDLRNQVRYDYRAPDRLFAQWRSDRQERRLYYDGRTMTVYAPRIGFYAQQELQGSVASLLRRAAQDFDVIFPLPDLFYWAASDAPAYDIQSARTIGYARIAGADTDQYLFRQPGIDWQIWIERGARRAPRKVVITDTTDPDRSSLIALIQWNPNVTLPDSQFTFKPPAGADEIELVAIVEEAAR